MKIRALFCFVWGAISLACVVAIAQRPPAHGLILPGTSVAGVKLGSGFAAFESIFPRHPKIDEDLDNVVCGAGRSYHWLDLTKNANGVYAYLKAGKIYQLSVQTPRFLLPNGLKIEASEKQVKAAYPHGHAYTLIGSGMPAVGGKDLTYWVDKKNGVAFELYWNEQMRQRLVRAIDIFRPGALYLPNGCVSPPQEWRDLTNEKQ